MRKFLGKRSNLLRALLPAIFLFALPAAECQKEAPCATPVIAAVSPSVWPVGQTIDVTITGTGFYTVDGFGCWEAAVRVSESTGLVGFSQVNVIGPSEVDAVVTVPSTVPAETACVEVAAIGVEVVTSNAGVQANAGTGATCTGTGNLAAFPVQIVTGGPTIASVTPLGWWASKKAEVTITGTGFLTSSDPGGPSQVTATAAGVTLSNVQVVSATQITANVEVTKDTPAETVTLTVTNPPTNGSPNTATASPTPVVLPAPVIQWRGRTISRDNAKTRKVKTGRPVELTTTPATLPGGFTISQSTWDIDGTTIKSYAADDSGITLEETDLHTQNTSFYWLYPDTGLNVTYDYCATGSDGTQYCTSPQAKATFDAKGPNSSLSTWDSGEATIEQLEVCTDNNNEAPYLGYGELSGPAPGCSGPQTGTPGIKLIASGVSGGKAVFVQLIDSDSRTYTNAVGSATCTHTANLDTQYPYPPHKNEPNVAPDGPEIPLPTPDLSAARNYLATMYLLWQPAQLSGTSMQSIPVPIGHQQWTFSASTDQRQPIGRGRWEKPTLTAHGDTGDYAVSHDTDNNLHGYPIWTALATEICPSGK